MMSLRSQSLNRLEMHSIKIIKAICSRHDVLNSTEADYLFDSNLSGLGRVVVKFDSISSHSLIRFSLNPLAIAQDPALYFKIALPGLVAQAALKVKAQQEGVEYKEHGNEWREILTDMGYAEAAIPNLSSEEVDTRANRIHKGEAAFVCACDHDEAVRIVVNRNDSLREYLSGEVMCETCYKPFGLVSPDNLQGMLKQHVLYLKQFPEVRTSQ